MPVRPPVRVVIADDQQLVRSALRAIVDSEPDLEVVGEAADGAAAVELVRRLAPDVVLMDVRMPRLDGVAATRALLAGPAARPGAPRVLILTTYDVDAYVVQALRAGASGYLLKDAPADRLIDAIRALADGEAILAPSVTRRLLERFADTPAAPADSDGAALRALLSTREADVLLLVADGLSNGQIGEALNLAASTVKSHIQKILAKLGLHNRVQLAIAAYDAGLASPRGYPAGQAVSDDSRRARDAGHPGLGLYGVSPPTAPPTGRPTGV